MASCGADRILNSPNEVVMFLISLYLVSKEGFSTSLWANDLVQVEKFIVNGG